MEETNNKIIIGTISKYLDKKTIQGNTVNFEHLVLLDVLISNYKYALSQFEAGNKRYNSILQQLLLKINNLKYFCPEVCVYKNKITYFNNTSLKTRSIGNFTEE